MKSDYRFRLVRVEGRLTLQITRTAYSPFIWEVWLENGKLAMGSVFSNKKLPAHIKQVAFDSLHLYYLKLG